MDELEKEFKKLTFKKFLKLKENQKEEKKVKTTKKIRIQICGNCFKIPNGGICCLEYDNKKRKGRKVNLDDRYNFNKIFSKS